MKRSFAILGAERKMWRVPPRAVAYSIFLAAAPLQASAQEQVVTGIRLRPACTSTFPLGNLFDAGEDSARTLLVELISAERKRPETPAVAQAGDASWIVHLVRWDSDNIARERWFVFSHDSSPAGRTISATRLYGARRLGFIAAHEKARGDRIEYRLAVTKTRSAASESFGRLLEIATGTAGTAAQAGSILPGWMCGNRVVEVAHVPSEILVRLLYDKGEGTEPREASKMTFRNEGLSRFDFSVGLPVNRIKQLQYTAKDDSVRVKEIDRQNLIGLVHVYLLRPYDTRDRPGIAPLSLVAGAALSGKPLDRLVLGLATGIRWAQLFAGVARDRVSEPKTLQVEAAASESQLDADLRGTYQTKFVWGLSISPQIVLDALR